ncbi:enoyl-CoA hydratase/isomerase family protein [Mycobacterium kansasii]|uniref:Enoyl-CoA hydratase/isomerase family protein n=1 Tax=Mycobacterium kansasii TaxID=1768 RepID=A0A1V3WUZ2_MYCKA|nr:enoyl-CoA hydratase/isomerase family protein [Mycobacterium kansasii]
MEEVVRYEKDPTTRIATITFDRPGHLNAPTIAARLHYADLLHRASIDDDVKVLVIRGAGEDLGSGADLEEFMDVMNSADQGPRLAEFRIGADEVKYPPIGSFRHGASVSQWYANPNSGIRGLQDFKKISILEVKGYCYGWHFYQAADADLVISSDDALFGHPSFRYYGWARGCGGGRRPWASGNFRRWCSPEGLSPPRRCMTATSSTAWCPATNSKPRCGSTRWRAHATGPATPCSCRRCSSRS